jgi:hypothetical protein
MITWEREIYVSLLVEHWEKEKQRVEAEKQNRKKR